MSLKKLSERLGIKRPVDTEPATIHIARMLEAILDRVELLEKQMAAVQDGCAYREPITHDEEERK